jgi:hypothetical protein
MYPRWSIIYVGCCAQLSILHFGSRFTKKKPDFDTPKMEKTLFWDEAKIGLRGHSKDHTRVRYSLVPTNYTIIRAEPSLFDIKLMQPQTW